jgi:beta-lactamase superfamily II metal-dependent hydrolase
MNNKYAFAYVCVVSIILFALVLTVFAAPGPEIIQVSFINVGQGDSALIRDTHGFDVLIDGGKTSAGPTAMRALDKSSFNAICWGNRQPTLFDASARGG